MPMCTYVSNGQVFEWSRRVTDDKITDMLTEMNATGRDWAVEPVDTRPHRFRRWKVVRLYSLLVRISGDEWQVINFCPRENSEWTITTMVEPQTLKAFMLGYLAGASRKMSDEQMPDK